MMVAVGVAAVVAALITAPAEPPPPGTTTTIGAPATTTPPPSAALVALRPEPVAADPPAPPPGTTTTGAPHRLPAGARYGPFPAVSAPQGIRIGERAETLRNGALRAHSGGSAPPARSSLDG